MPATLSGLASLGAKLIVQRRRGGVRSLAGREFERIIEHGEEVAPAPPFQIYQEGAPPRSVDSVEPFTEAARKGASEFALLTPVKARPILVITRSRCFNGRSANAD